MNEFISSSDFIFIGEAISQNSPSVGKSSSLDKHSWVTRNYKVVSPFKGSLRVGQTVEVLQQLGDLTFLPNKDHPNQELIALGKSYKGAGTSVLSRRPYYAGFNYNCYVYDFSYEDLIKRLVQRKAKWYSFLLH